MYRHSLSSRAYFTEASYTSTPNIFKNDVHWANPMNLDSDDDDGLPHTFVSAASFYSTASSTAHGFSFLVGDIVAIDETIHRQLLSMHNQVNSDTLHTVVNEYVVTETGTRVEVKNCILEKMQVRLPTEKVELVERRCGSPSSTPYRYRARSGSFSSFENNPLVTNLEFETEEEAYPGSPQSGNRRRLLSSSTTETQSPQHSSLNRVHSVLELERQVSGASSPQTRRRQNSLARQLLNTNPTSEETYSSNNIIQAPRHMSASDVFNPNGDNEPSQQHRKSLKSSKSFVDRLFGTHRKSPPNKATTISNNLQRESIPEPYSDDEDDYGNEAHPLDEETDFSSVHESHKTNKHNTSPKKTSDHPQQSPRKRSFFLPSSWRKGSLQNMIESFSIPSLAAAGKRASFRLSPRSQKKTVSEKFSPSQSSAEKPDTTTRNEEQRSTPTPVCIA